MRRRAFVTSALLVALLTAAAAQQQLDRSKPPVPGKVPELKVPTWTTSKLANGAQLIVADTIPSVLDALTGAIGKAEPKMVW